MSFCPATAEKLVKSGVVKFTTPLRVMKLRVAGSTTRIKSVDAENSIATGIEQPHPAERSDTTEQADPKGHAQMEIKRMASASTQTINNNLFSIR